MRGWIWVVLLLAVIPAFAQQPSPRLIPFQGRLTDQQGRAYSNGQFSLTFRLYSQAVGGTPIWTEVHRKVGVINGMVNVFLGSIASLDPVDFSQTRHLGITVDADDNPVTADPEMVPRQMIIPAFWAKQADNSTLLAGTNWSAILVNGNNPASGFIRGDRLQASGVTTDRIAPNAITTDRIATGAVQTTDIGDGQITVEKLSPSFALDTVIPPGTIQAFGGNTIPAGWLLCDGAFVSSGQYPRLYSAISSNWGAGVLGSTNDFSLPDLRGYFLRGVSGASAADPDRATRIAASVGGNIGNLVGSIQSDQLKSHTHTYLDYWAAAGDQGFGAIDSFDSGSSDALWQERTGRTTGATGGNETRPKNAYVHYIIKY